MTEDELLAEVKREWEHWAGHLGLQNWHAKFVVKKSKVYNLSVSRVVGGYPRVVVLINPKPDWEGTMPPSWHVLHEVLHVLLDEMRNWAYCHSTLSLTNRRVSDFDSFASFEEKAVDELASGLWRLHEQTGCGTPVISLMEPLSMETLAERARALAPGAGAR